jgi:deoxyribonuclease V
MRYIKAPVKNIVTPVVKHMLSSYNRRVKAQNLHSWQLTIPEARELQLRLAGEVICRGSVNQPRLIGGLDISVKRNGPARAAAVVLSYPGLEPVEVKTLEGEPPFPYIPGLLSFREAPLMLAVCEQLKSAPDLIMVDGQGIAHPRRFGIASHLGVLLDIPTIGCAKSRLCGQYETPAEEAASYNDLVDNGEVIGAVLRTKKRTRPLFVSIGHRTDLATVISFVLACCRGYRLPEPTRMAHLAAGGNLLMEAGRATMQTRDKVIQ